MNYNKFQQFLSYLLIFILLFSITFRFPSLEFKASAKSNNIYNLVSIIVDEETFLSIEGELKIYGKDISSVLENTKVVILPVPKDTTPFQIASMNESLFNEGYKSLSKVDFESKLIGTVLVGNIPIPVAKKENQSSRTILPYIDFDDKSYIFNKINGVYEYNNNNTSGIKPEIWHGIISPNTGDKKNDITSLKEYFKKNHEYYIGEGFYNKNLNVINGDPDLDLSDSYTPYVFYHDSLRENSSLNYNSYLSYKEGYLANKEDIIYGRYTTEFANKLKNELMSYSEDELYLLAKKIDPNFDIPKESSDVLKNIPDIQSRHIINNIVKRFIEIFASGGIGELRENVYNAGRYNYGQEVNVDFIPYLISVLDNTNDQLIKDYTSLIENEIDEIIKNGLSRNIVFPSTYSKLELKSYEKYENYLFGRKASNIDKAEDCTIYRGSTLYSGQLVEANRGNNINNIEKDLKTLENLGQVCLTNLDSKASLLGLWGKNSPFNLDEKSTNNGLINLKDKDLKGAITPIFDIDGAKKDFEEKNIASPLNCFNDNLLLSELRECTNSNVKDDKKDCIQLLKYKLPANEKGIGAINWSCLSKSNTRTYNLDKTFEENYDTLSAKKCEKLYIFLNGDIVKESVYKEKCTYKKYEGQRIKVCDCSKDDLNPDRWITKKWEYKTASSYIMHKSPTLEELSSQSKSMLAPSLPIDKNRYIDFISSNGNLEKIYYPQLFRLKIEDKKLMTLDSISEEFDKMLDEKSKELNLIIDSNNTNTGITFDSKLNSYFSTGKYPESNIDLKEYLKSKGTEKIQIFGKEKVLSHYDIILFAIYWNNLNSVSAKYKFVIENYLSDQINNEKKFYLPKNKNQYEIAYLGSKGDTQNMFIGIDPESKSKNPYADIISNNQKLNTKIIGANIALKDSSVDNKKNTCASPEGVPIWEWLPAIMCRLKEMMPPTIYIGDGKCGPGFLKNLSEEEQEYFNQCNGDFNKNGINDCLEKRLFNGKIILGTESQKYHYNSNIPLKVSIVDSNEEDILFIDTINVDYELIKIEAPINDKLPISQNNIKTVYDLKDQNNNNKSIWNKYLDFKDQSVRISGGKATYGASVKNKEVNLYFQAKISVSDNENVEKFNIKSNVLKVEVRGEQLSVGTYKTNDFNEENDSRFIGSSVEADSSTNIYLLDSYNNSINSVKNIIQNNSSSKQKLIFGIENISIDGKLNPINYPLKVQIKSKEGEILKEEIINDINGFFPFNSILKSGDYIFSVSDKSGLTSTRTFNVLPAKPTKIDITLGSNILKSDGSISTNFISILDDYNNVVSGNMYKVKMDIKGNNIDFFDNGKNSLITNIFEGYKVFRLISKNNSGISDLSVSLIDDNGNNILSNSKTIKVIDDFDLVLYKNDEIKVAGDNYKIGVELRDKKGNILNDFNSRIYMKVNSHFIELEKDYFELKNGVGNIKFNTKTKAAKDIPIEFQIEGMGKIISEKITILPDNPIKMDLVLSKTKMEASLEEYSNLSVELKDRYNNLVFNDSNTDLKLEILPEYSNIVSIQKDNQKVKDGKANFKIYGTQNPGTAYFKVSSSPNLNKNSFIIEDKEKIYNNGIGENAGKIETFYLLNKEKLNKMQYNSIYTTLLGASYGDIEQENYLAGSIIFDKNSKALAVTTLLSDPYSLNQTLSISNNGGIERLYGESDLSQDVETNVFVNNGELYIDVFNNSLNISIGKIYYKIPNNVKFSICEKDTICDNLLDETNIVGNNIHNDYKFFNSSNKLILVDNNGKNLLEIDSEGKIIKKTNIDFNVSSKNSSQLVLDIIYQNKVIGSIGINIISDNINITRDELIFNTKLNKSSNGIFILLNSLFYGYYLYGKGVNKKVVLYYNDPFGSNKTLNTFSRNQLYSYENFDNSAGLGWSNGNKTLLSFASGKSVGESLKDYSSFSSINIGDPVIKLKKIKKSFDNIKDFKQFESGIGEIINNSPDLKDFRVFDYNNDGLEDILLIKNNGYMQLLENRNGSFLDLGNLAYIADISSLGNVKTGDFTGDGYDDIFFIDKDSKPYLLNNINKKFQRFPLANKLNINGKIVRAEVFDMDNDGIDDLIILDDKGGINIFYGGGNSANPIFTKLNLSNSYGIEMDKNIRTDGALIYFDGLYQLGTTDYSYLINENKKYINGVQNNTIIKSEGKVEDTVNYDLINSYIFENILYDKNESKNINYTGGITDLPNFKKTTTFIKSEYVETLGLKIEKVYKDVNGSMASQGDKIDVEIKLTNKTNLTINDIAYIENINSLIDFDEKTVLNSKNLQFKKPLNGYSFLLDNFSLNPNETIIINYSGILKKLQYLDIEVGLFESGEDGDDKYGDVIVKLDKRNCGETMDIYRSVSARLYQKGIKEAKCDNTPLPESLEKNSIDKNKNNVPDYIEELSIDEIKRRDFAEDKLLNNKLISYSNDKFGMSNSISLDLGEMGKDIEKGLDKVQDFVNGLSCGFNNGACFSTPLNWAPLAPGGDPTLFGYPIGDGFRINEGIPIFSSLTGLQAVCGTTPCCLPTVWPTSSLGYIPGPFCGPPSAGGYLGVWNPSNNFRLFVSPTLTGGVGTAMCFGGPAITSGLTNPPGLHPIVPGGNCIVLAQAILGCKNDGSDGDPSSLGELIPGNGGANGYGLINGNCTIKTPKKSITKDYVKKYYEHITGKRGVNGLGNVNGAIEDHSSFRGDSLFSINGTGTPVEVTFDTESGNFDFSDIQKIVQKRIKSFPGFLMNWVTRQIEEIVTKLTDFPTLFIILPDFSGIYDSDLTWSENRKNWKNKVSKDLDLIKFNQDGSLGEKVKSANSSIKEAYEFISTLPLVNIEPQTVSISIPWISETELEKALNSRFATLDIRKEELKNAANSWSFGGACELTDEESQKSCEEQNKISQKLLLEAEGLIRSLEKNLQTIDDYANIPEKINKLINMKEEYLEQILCNIESISEIMGGRIGRNGEIFKSWVEFYILTKAILKSWQMLIDIFVDFEEGCKECKNERQDLMGFIFRLISMVIPDIPVIEFPKWPDIILDLHNIRAGLDISLPEFNITPRPILLPDLPNLSLPSVPNASLNLPELPLLPELVIPDLPPLPSLPTIELPDLPPAPSLPNLLGALEIILDIGKLVTKAMCILKSSPFVPEWRAGDQIAFLTERNGYLPTDFIDLSLPQFTLPFVDAIQVSSYVNLEFDTEFITELASQIASPINRFNSDFSNLFNFSIKDIDFSGEVPDELNLNIDNSGNTEFNIQSSVKKENNLVYGISEIYKNILLKLTKINKEKDIELTNQELKEKIYSLFSKEDIISDPSFDKLDLLWKDLNNYSFNNENILISKLQKEKDDKYGLLKDIINTEIIQNKKLRENFNKEVISGVRKMNDIKLGNSKIYNTNLEKYNNASIYNYNKIINGGDLNKWQEELDIIGKDVLFASKNLINKYEDGGSNLIAQNSVTTIDQNLLNNCPNSNPDYKYNYKGIYIVENGKSYRLFDYMKELTGNETYKLIDLDKDGDDDILYLMNGTLYLKENLSKNNNKLYLKEDPLVIKSKNNKFVNSLFLESINNIKSYISTNSLLNISFSPARGVNNYRLSYYEIIDKYYNEKNNSYIPQNKKRYLIDGIAGIGSVNLVKNYEKYDEKRNLVYISDVGDLRGVELNTDSIKNIKDDLNNGKAVVLGNGTNLFAGDSNVSIDYFDEIDGDTKTISIPKNSYIEMKSTINIINCNGNAYVKTGEKVTYAGTEIKQLVGKPLFIGTKIIYNGNNFETKKDAIINFRYYDGTSWSLNFNYDQSWELYDLGYQSVSSYSINSNCKNAFYYAKMNSFRNGIFSTISKQVLLSPQKQGDNIGVDMDLNSIKIPVYQDKIIDLTPYIERTGENIGIKEVYIDFDLLKDSDNDGNPRNDNDSQKMKNVNIIIEDDKILLEFYKFEELFDKKIGINILDNNGNKTIKEISFIVYSPTPEIINFESDLISGYINEKLNEEPINIFRVRGGELNKLENREGTGAVFTSDGNFDFLLGENNSEGLKIEKNGEIIALVNEKTGKISTVKSGYKIEVLSSNNLNNKLIYPQIILKDGEKNIYSEHIKISNKSINIIDNFEEIKNYKENGLFIKFLNSGNYKYNFIPQSNIKNPTSISINRLGSGANEDLFVIFNDGKINTLNDKYTLEYDTYDHYVIIKLIDRHFNKELAQILYKIDSQYVIQ